MVAVAVADSDPTEQHLLGRKIQVGGDDLVEPCPSHLRTGVQAVAARQQRQRADITAEVCPLAGTEPAIDAEEETDGRVEELVVAFDLLKPSGTVFTRGAERAV